MKSGWVERDAEAFAEQFAKSLGTETGVQRDLAHCVYATRLLGRDPKLVLHGGGNTSVKLVECARFGDEVEVLRVKSSGSDMAAIASDDMVAVRLLPMRQL